jgi:hypothetical protein
MWQVPARELLAIMLGLLAEQRLEVASLEHAATLGSQLERSGTGQPHAMRSPTGGRHRTLIWHRR